MNNPIGLMPFVADAFVDLVKDFENANLLGKIPSSDENLSVIIAQKGFTDPKEQYYSYIRNMMQQYIRNYVMLNQGKILNIRDFTDHFLLFIKNSSTGFPVTLSAWHSSKYSSIFSTGLAVSLTNMNIDDDKMKQAFMSSPCFGYYKNVCIKRGFSISHNSPWVLVADLDSPQMKPYLMKNRIFRIRSVFESYYRKAFLEDLNLLKINIISYYNNFVNSYPFFKENYYCGNNKLKSKLFARQPFDMSNINNLIDNKYWINYIIQLRNIEEEHPFDNKKIIELLKISLNYEKIFDIGFTMDYINKRFRAERKNKFGGLNSIIERNSTNERNNQ